MKTLTSPITTQSTAPQSGWSELYDLYLKSPITTPWGTTSILRLTDNPTGLAFFTPKLSPEDPGTQGNAQQYQPWPIKRALVRGESKFTNDKLQITASNVSTDFAQMVAAIEWYDTPVIIRKVSTTIASPTADDCAILWTGQVDAAKITELQLVFDCSNDLSTLQSLAPRENMHTNCRFQWGDDMCSAVKFRSDRYKSKTVGSGSSDTVVNSSDLTEDTATLGSYGTDRVNPLADAAITASSEGSTSASHSCTVQAYPFGGDPTPIYVTAATLPSELSVSFTASVMPTGLNAGQVYGVVRIFDGTGAYIGFLPYDLDTFEYIPYTDAGTSVSWVGVVTGGSTAANVKSSKPGSWTISDLGDWGTASNGFYQLSDAQAGRTNMGLKPWIKFDFGSARAINTWRFQSVPGLPLDQLVRLIQIGHSSDDIFYTWLTYFELPPTGGVYYDAIMPRDAGAVPSRRYWVINIRTLWGPAFSGSLLHKVQAFTDSRHFWASGRITFDPATTTVALRNWSCRVRESYSGKIVVPKLPAAPVAGDTFTISRGCPRTFNACAERSNSVRFGGFTDLPYQIIIR